MKQKPHVKLNWDNGFYPRLDDNMFFGIGYDYFGLENLSRGAKGQNGNYRMWPNRTCHGDRWSLYRDSDGAFAFEKYDSEKDCELAAERWCLEDI